MVGKAMICRRNRYRQTAERKQELVRRRKGSRRNSDDGNGVDHAKGSRDKDPVLESFWCGEGKKPKGATAGQTTGLEVASCPTQGLGYKGSK